jgi:hypothetical protein
VNVTRRGALSNADNRLYLLRSKREEKKQEACVLDSQGHGRVVLQVAREGISDILGKVHLWHPRWWWLDAWVLKVWEVERVYPWIPWEMLGRCLGSHSSHIWL